MTNEVKVRPVLSSDYTEWRILWEGYNSFYGRKDETALPPRIIEMTWSRLFDSYEPVHAMVAEDSDNLIGLVHFLFHRSTINIEPVCYIQDLFTSENARGKGVGHALISKASEQAKNAGTKQIYWQTHESNTVAMRLYEKVVEKSGFVVYRKTL